MARALFHAEINEIRLSTVMRRFNYTVSAVAVKELSQSLAADQGGDASATR